MFPFFFFVLPFMARRANSEVTVAVIDGENELSIQPVELFHRRCNKAMAMGVKEFTAQGWQRFVANHNSLDGVLTDPLCARLPTSRAIDIRHPEGNNDQLIWVRASTDREYLVEAQLRAGVVRPQETLDHGVVPVV